MTHVNHRTLAQSGVEFAALLSAVFSLQVVKTIDVGFLNRSVYSTKILQFESLKEIFNQRNEFLRTRKPK